MTEPTDAAVRKTWTDWAAKNVGGSDERVALSVDAAIRVLENGGTREAAAQAALEAAEHHTLASDVAFSVLKNGGTQEAAQATAFAALMERKGGGPAATALAAMREMDGGARTAEPKPRKTSLKRWLFRLVVLLIGLFILAAFLA